MFQMSGVLRSSFSPFPLSGDLRWEIGRPFIKLLRDPYLIIRAPAYASADPFLWEGGLLETYDLMAGFLGLSPREDSS